MANNVEKCIAANAIKHGTLILGQPFPANAISMIDENSFVSNNPDLTVLQAQLDGRADDVGYYSN